MTSDPTDSDLQGVSSVGISPASHRITAGALPDAALVCVPPWPVRRRPRRCYSIRRTCGQWAPVWPAARGLGPAPSRGAESLREGAPSVV